MGIHGNLSTMNVADLLQFLATGKKIFFERGDFFQGFGMIKDEQVFGKFGVGAEINLAQSFGHLIGGGGIEAGAGEDDAQWIDVAAERDPAHEGGLEQGGAAAHERVVDAVARPGQPAEVAPAYVLLASNDGSYITGAMIPVTGGRPML